MVLKKGGDIIFTAQDLLVQYSAQNRTKSLRVCCPPSHLDANQQEKSSARTLDLYKRTCLFDWADLGGQKRK
jgi:hypothetical protein